MSTWSLSYLLEGLHHDLQQSLETARKCMGHPVTKGDATESVWLQLLQTYLPKRYSAEKAHVVDSHGKFSEQIDVVIFDRQYSPFIFKFREQTIIPAESVYAVFEAKQAINANEVSYAKKKVASVRNLYRTSLPVPCVEGIQRAKPLIRIYGGLLTLESDWSPPLEQPLVNSLSDGNSAGILDIGCVAAHGYFSLDQQTGIYNIIKGGKPATAFLFKLISLLQFSGTVPMIDIQAYAQWLVK